MKTTTTLAALAALTFTLGAPPADAASLNGTWRGAGYIEPSEGRRERVTCVATYSRRSRTVFSVRATCASSSGSIRQTGEVLLVRPNTYVGDFYNQQFNIGGRLRIAVRGRRQTVTLSSSNGNGRLSLSKR